LHSPHGFRKWQKQKLKFLEKSFKTTHRPIHSTFKMKVGTVVVLRASVLPAERDRFAGHYAIVSHCEDENWSRKTMTFKNWNNTCTVRLLKVKRFGMLPEIIKAKHLEDKETHVWRIRDCIIQEDYSLSTEVLEELKLL
jgi:hypothetical protein